MAAFLAETMAENGLTKPYYYEPFAGGAGAGLQLLRTGKVSEVFINDADPCVASFWRAALEEPMRFAERILTVPLEINEWRRQQAICADVTSHTPFEVGFATFYLNRCNRSGVLLGAGPIGGQAQQGTWRLDARFNRQTLAKRILALHALREAIHIDQSDALLFLRDRLPRGAARSGVFVYLDPPYVNKGQRLYLNSYASNDHARLAQYMKAQRVLPWVMSYDDTPLVRDLYDRQQIRHIPIRYSLQKKRKARELLISPSYILIPK